MTRVSKHTLPEKELQQLRQQFSKTIGRLSLSQSDLFLDDLLGPEEYTMLAKRLAAIVLYMEGNSTYTVWNALNISPSTADRIKLNYECGQYKHITASIKKNQAYYLEFWKALEAVLQLGLPPRGKGRWKSVLKNLQK
jgi:uncharacterized protein YerC